MFNFENVTNTRGGGSLQLEDIKVFSQNRIRIGVDARKKLGLKEDGHILIQKDKNSGNMYIAAVDKDSGLGRPVNDKGEFTHKTIAHLLGGQHSEWTVDEEGNEFQGVTYHELKKEVEGSSVKDMLAETANETDERASLDLDEDKEEVSKTEESEEEEEEEAEEARD